ncbi:MAG: hypothetical protein U9N81_08675 [Bacillota bacterium]|nr:hypothetical protein [Bacillota bacterium]
MADHVILFQPVYAAEGNITELFLKDPHTEPCHDPRTIHSVRCALAKTYVTDLITQGKIIKRTFHRSAPVPFYLPDGRVYVPLKMREQRINRDSCYGFVEINAVKALRETKHNTDLLLTTGHRISIFTSITPHVRSFTLS